MRNISCRNPVKRVTVKETPIRSPKSSLPTNLPHVPIPMTRAAAERLGKRLAGAAIPDTEDLEHLLAFLRAYEKAMATAQDVIFDATGLVATARIKTTQSLVEKLRREPTKLPTIQDIAGLRLICSHRTEQRSWALSLEILFAMHGGEQDLARASRYIDRIQHPSHGYRAIHVVVRVDGLPVEIQVRTDLQDKWAQLVEVLSDRWGRQIRYGEPPHYPQHVVGGASLTRKAVMSAILSLSDAIAEVERADDVDQINVMFEQTDEFIGADTREEWRAARSSRAAARARLRIYLEQIAEAASEWQQ